MAPSKTRYAVVDAAEYEELVRAFEAAIRAEAGHKASDHDECGESCEVETLVRSLVARAVRAEER